MDGSLERLVNPDEYLKRKIPEFIAKGEFGLASGDQAGDGYQRIWFNESISADEVSFDADVYLLRKDIAKAVGVDSPVGKPLLPAPPTFDGEGMVSQSDSEAIAVGVASNHRIVLTGDIPPELWNKVGIRLIPKLRAAAQPTLSVIFAVDLDSDRAANLKREIAQALDDLGLTNKIKIEDR